MKERILLGITLAMLSGDLLAEKQHSFSAGWSQTEEVFEGRNRDFSYQPETYSLSYAYTFSASWTAGIDFWQGEDRRRFSSPDIMFDQDHQGVSISISQYLDSIGLHFSITRSDARLDLSDPIYSKTYREETDAFDASVALDYQFLSNDFMLTPSLSIGWQNLETDSKISGSTLDALFVQRDLQQTVTRATAGINLGYLFDLGEGILLLPSVDLSWTEYLDSNGDQQDQVVFQGPRGNRSSRVSNSTFNASDDGSGVAVITLSLIRENLYVNLSYSEAIALENKYASSAMTLGVSY